jgi:hypothetical protein
MYPGRTVRAMFETATSKKFDKSCAFVTFIKHCPVSLIKIVAPDDDDDETVAVVGVDGGPFVA